MESIAIVGIANLFPGSKTPTEFWRKLLDKQDCRSVATSKQMGVDPEKYTGKKGDVDKFYCVHGGFIHDFDFDSSPFSQSSALQDDYLNGLDDLNKWALYVTEKALKDAGYWQSKSLSECGVILGNLSFPTKKSNPLFLPLYHHAVDSALKHALGSDFQLSGYQNRQVATSSHPDNALIAGYPSALIAKAAGLGGAHFSLDAACASSCYSLKLACDYLHTGKADMMLAGAVSSADPLFVNMGFSIFQAYPENNVHAPFDQTSQGLFAGEGAGMMVLKRYSDALRDGDKIHAIIKGGALSNDGRGEFVLSPNTKGQVLVYQRAYEDAGVDPSDVDYIECHATGTPKGDNVELGSMETFFSQYDNKPLLGSVKSNLGHLLTAAGMPGMTKAIWALNEEKIPATINLKQPIASKNEFFSGQQMPTEVTPWPNNNGSSTPKTAGVSVFGFGGSNAHIVLQQHTGEIPENFDKELKERHCASLAIVGMDAHFGNATNLSEFEALVLNNNNTFRALPKKRWKGLENNAQLMASIGLEDAPLGGYVENFDIDFLRFKIPPNEHDCLIPQQLMMMKVADNAAKDAELTEGSNVAVIVAMGVELELHQYRGRVNLATQIEETLRAQGVTLSLEQQEQLTNIAKDGVAHAAQLNQYTSFIGNIMASRISALWDFSGPAITLSAEENSGYRSIELAQNLFETSDVEAVIIAGVDLAGSIENITLRQHYGSVNAKAENLQSNVLAQDKWLVGEGAAAFVVKPSNELEGQGCYATIDGIAFENGLSVESMTKAAKRSLQQSSIEASDVNFIEVHASGFENENKIESGLISNLYPKTAVGSVKSNIGHTFNASGVASIIKSAVLLAKNSSENTEAKKQRIAINGLGKDESCCHVVLSSVSQSKSTSRGQLNSNLSSLSSSNSSLSSNAKAEEAGILNTSAKRKPQLIKTITLGGHDIEGAIHAEIAKLPTLRNAFSNQTLTPNANCIVLNKLFETEIKTKAKNKIATLKQFDTLTGGENTYEQKFNNENINGAYALETDAVTKTVNTVTKSVKTRVKTKVSPYIDQVHDTHLAFLKTRQLAEQHIANLIHREQTGNEQPSPGSKPFSDENYEGHETHATQEFNALDNIGKREVVSTIRESASSLANVKSGYQYPELLLKEQFSTPKNVIWDIADLVEFAEGNIANVFGQDYQIIDTYSRRVRLPTTDYLLVSRVTALQANKLDFKPSYMCTEYDIPVDAPFLIDGQIPWSVAVESGQCDLLLISYIGIDFQAKGERVYRLLDCELTFLEEMAFGGQTLRYEIHIDSYAKNGEQLLFFFHYDCYVGDKKVLIMRNGCAGFFTDEELADGKGVILNDKDKAQLANAKVSRFDAPWSQHRQQFDYQDMMKLVNGDIAGCFGRHYDQQGRNPSLKFSSEKFLMIERITKIDQHGGHWGLGVLEGQKDLAPEHWYFPCHFKDDQVMAGSLMSEGCGQMAMFFMLSLGMHHQVTNARFQPMPGESQTVRCRGQVIPQHNTLTYRMEVTELGMLPQPFLKANIEIILDGKAVVDFKNLSVMITEQDENSPYPVDISNLIAKPVIESRIDSETKKESSVSEAKPSASERKSSANNVDERGVAAFKNAEQPLMWVESDLSAKTNKGVVPIKHREAPQVIGQNRVPDTVPFTPWHLFEFATGNISNCFGKDFDVYQGRIPPRTPCGDLQVVTQVTQVSGKRLALKNPASCVAEYYVPSDAWYFTKNSHDNWMPYSLIMEIALQPNGFISGYMGTTLKYPEKDLFFRNLDGAGDLIKAVDLRDQTIVNRSVLLSTAVAGGAIIQNFTFELYVKGKQGQSDELFYRGTAVFGYFSEDSLTNQLGLDNGKTTLPWFKQKNIAASELHVVNLADENHEFYQKNLTQPHYRLAGGQMNFVDTVTIVEGGGEHNIAYILGERTVDASDWFFRYHFHQDPVMPGSLGVEAIIELLQTYALKNKLGANFSNPRFIAPLTEVKWKYRGQITPVNKQMSLDVDITRIEENDGEVRLMGNANLSKDGLRIYEVKDIVLSIVEA